MTTTGNAPPNEVKRASYYLELLEKRVSTARGKPFTLPYEGKEALKRIKTLKGAYGSDPAVLDLFERARRALLASKGQSFEITSEMLAYRLSEAQLVESLSAVVAVEWETMRDAVLAEDGAIVQPFPTLDPEEVGVRAIEGKPLILEDFRYPDNHFVDTGADFVSVGDGQTGMYFIDLSGRAWRTAYEALKRFRREVSDDLPQPWTVVGRITGLDLKVPQAGEAPSAPAVMGWVVEPVALYVPGKALALPAEADEAQGTYIGEEAARALKAESYSVTEVPPGIGADAVVEIFAVAVKEKNYALFSECVDPSWLATPKSRARLRYYWDNNQERFRKLYVHVRANGVSEVRVLRGETFKDDESFFLTDDDIAEVQAHAQPLLEQATVYVERFDERGRQVGLPNPIFLRRPEGGEWRLYSGFPL